MAHFLDVARIATIIHLEKQLNLDKELIYGSALLHDIGRYVQYDNGTPHEIASAEMAPIILQDCGFSDLEISSITDAILSHRKESMAGVNNLAGIIYQADKASRACFACKMESECNWKSNKKNLLIKY